MYSIKETATDSNHILDVREYHMELFPGKTSTLTVENQKRPNLIVYKHDADTGEPIANTGLKSGRQTSQLDRSRRTRGKAELKNLLPGVYEINQKKTVPSPLLLSAHPACDPLPQPRHTVYFENHQKPT